MQSLKIQASIFAKIDKILLKFIRKYKGPRIAERDNFDKSKVGGLTLYDFKMYS